MNRPDYAFLLDETASNDPITARFPRTSREAFGHHAPSDPLPPGISFNQQQRAEWRAILLAIVVIGGLAAMAVI